MSADRPRWIVYPPAVLDFEAQVRVVYPHGGWPAIRAEVSSGRLQGFAAERLTDLSLRIAEIQDFIVMLQANKVHFLATTEGIDTRVAGYAPLLACARAMAEAKRADYSAAIRNGQARAVAAGGRPPGRAPYLDPDLAARARKMLAAGRSAWYVRKKLKISYDAVRRLSQEGPTP